MIWPKEKPKNTPGPWEYFQGAICFGPPEERMVLCTPHLHQGTPEADCVLMAAAPELLAALEALVDKVEARWHEEIKYAPVSMGQHLIEARRAIRKAKAQS